MEKLFLSPSTQEWNIYKTGENEELEMRLIAAAAAPYLIAAGYIVKIGGKISAKASVQESNDWGADYHIAIHSNAGGGDGTVTFYDSTNSASRKMATCIQNAIAPISPGADDGIKPGDKFVEINGPHKVATLVEVEFHDNLIGADWIRDNEDLIGKTLAEGILKYFGKILPNLQSAPAGWQRFWRLKGKNGDYFYTSSKSEVSSAVSLLGYTYEGPAFDIAINDPTNTIMIYRLYKNGFHIYSTYAEAVAIQKQGWNFEGPVAKVGTKGIEVIRLIKGDVHLYTTSTTEVQAAIAQGWVREGVAFRCGLN